VTEAIVTILFSRCVSSAFAFAVATQRDLFWGGVWGCATAFVFLFYGLTRKPLELNYLNPWRKPIPVWAARLIYLPLGGLCLFFALRDLVRGLR
jgi:hypothetical protein